MAGHKRWSEIKHKRKKEDKTRVLIFGGSGWLARRFYTDLRLLGFQTWIAESSVDITKSYIVDKAVETVNPHFILNCAGKTGRPNIDWCETHRVETWRSNVLGAKVLLDACLKYGIAMVHLSSGCIYNGTSPNPGGFKEEDSPCPVSYYAETKVQAEEILKAHLDSVLIARLRMPIDKHPNSRNLITKLAGYGKVIDVLNSVSIVDDLVFSLAKLMHKRRTGIYNIVSPGSVFHRDIMAWYRKIVDQRHEYELIPAENLFKQGLAKAGRSNCILSTAKLEKEKIYLPTAEWGIKFCLGQYAKELSDYLAALNQKREGI